MTQDPSAGPYEGTAVPPGEDQTLPPEELQPESQGNDPYEALDGELGEGDLDTTGEEPVDDPEAAAEESTAVATEPGPDSGAEDELTAPDSSVSDDELVDGAPSEEGFAGAGEGGPTEQGPDDVTGGDARGSVL